MVLDWIILDGMVLDGDNIGYPSPPCAQVRPDRKLKRSRLGIRLGGVLVYLATIPKFPDAWKYGILTGPVLDRAPQLG